MWHFSITRNQTCTRDFFLQGAFGAEALCRLCFLLTGLFLLQPQSLPAQAFNFVSYSLPEGLPQSQVYALCQDQRGYLWAGTQGGGLSRFDGQHFLNFTTADGLPSNYINALLIDKRQRLWIGANQGLCRYDGERFERLRLAGSNDSVEVYALALVQGQSVWIGTDRGLFACTLDEPEAKPVDLPGAGAPLRVTAIFPSPWGIWVGTSRGAWLIGQHSIHLGEKNGLPGTVFAFAADDRQQVWAACLNGLAVLDARQPRVLRVFRDAPLTNAVSLCQSPAGRIWVGTTDAGVLRYNPADSSWQQWTERDGLPHPHVHTLLLDLAGQLWAGTSGGGLVRLSRQPFRHFDQSRGLAGNRVYALYEDRAGRLWLGVSQNGLQVLDSTGLHAFERDSGYLRIKCKAIAGDERGDLWVGTEGKGIAVFDSTGMQRMTRENGLLPGNLVQAIVPGNSGSMWAATLGGGIAKLTPLPEGGYAGRAFGLRDGLPDLQVQTLRGDSEGRIWFATQSGQIGWINNDRVEGVFDASNGLPGVPVRCLAFDGQGRIWAGTKGGGIWWADRKTKHPQFQPLPPAVRLSSPNIYLLHIDRAGQLWAGTETGVNKIIFAPDGAVAETQHFGRAEGFLGIETCQDAVLEDHGGRLWFGTMNGLSQYLSTHWERKTVPPVLHFETIALFYKPLPETAYAAWAAPGGGISAGLELPYFQNHLSFAFCAVDLSNPEGIRYRWRLAGAETGWSPLSAQQQVNYANLPPGGYIFEVQATTDGMTFSAPLSAIFTIRQPFWRLWWFQVLAALGLAGLVALAAWRWVRRMRRIESARREQLEVENRLLQLEQKALQLQMNPHFIFNALTSIQALITEQHYPTARQEINGFAKLMRSILNNSRRQTISLQKEANTLAQYLRIEQFCHQHKFDFDIELPESADPEEVEIPPMLLQPFVENAVVHGVAPLPYPGKIDIRFALEKDILCCEIRDNGIGRERAARLREEKKPGHQSAALQVTQERLEALRAGRPYTALDMKDILDEKGDIAGTSVTVRLPAKLEF